jgi:hypothetical protein
VLLAVLAAGAVYAVAASGQGEGTRIGLIVVNSDTGTKVIPPAIHKGDPRPGARVLGRLRVQDPNGHPRGHLIAVCTVVDRHDVSCTYSLRLGEGTIEAQGTGRTDSTSGVVAVVGGTGRYVGASGVLRQQPETQAGRTPLTVELR